jgi:hypothetical protein
MALTTLPCATALACENNSLLKSFLFKVVQKSENVVKLKVRQTAVLNYQGKLHAFCQTPSCT